MTTQTILDIVVILLLVPTIVYAGILNRRLGALRRSRDELARIVASFNDATLRAEAGIPKLKKATTEANHTLKDRVEKAQTLRDDLAFMVERAEELASRLEGAVRAARHEGVTAPAATAAPGPNFAPPAPSPRGMTAEPPPRTLAAATLSGAAAAPEAAAAADLRSALGAARAEARVTGTPGAAAAPARPRRGMAERSLADRAIDERSFAERAPADEPVILEEERSEAERELLKALQAAR
jgi:hypothetical protein